MIAKFHHKCAYKEVKEASTEAIRDVIKEQVERIGGGGGE